MGNFVSGSVYKKLEELSAEIVEEGSFATLFNLQAV
jgi:hypothetical protein